MLLICLIYLRESFFFNGVIVISFLFVRLNKSSDLKTIKYTIISLLDLRNTTETGWCPLNKKVTLGQIILTVAQDINKNVW